MPTIINTTPQQSESSGMGFFLAAIVVILFAILFFVYALPYIRSSMGGISPQINIPSQMNVNVKQTK